MLIELDGVRLELDWREISVILALKWCRSGVLSCSMLSRVEPDYGRLLVLLEKLEEKNLIMKLVVGRSCLVTLTERGKAAADKLIEIASKHGLL